MFNAIAAAPLGSSGQWQPYISSGIGRIQMVADVFSFNQNLNVLGTTEVDKGRFGWNIGTGVMGFGGAVGFRADIRYYRANSSSETFIVEDLDDELVQSVLGGLEFWRANAGVAFRW
jgi:hypothetical protein